MKKELQGKERIWIVILLKSASPDLLCSFGLQIYKPLYITTKIAER